MVDAWQEGKGAVSKMNSAFTIASEVPIVVGSGALETGAVVAGSSSADHATALVITATLTMNANNPDEVLNRICFLPLTASPARPLRHVVRPSPADQTVKARSSRQNSSMS